MVLKCDFQNQIPTVCVKSSDRNQNIIYCTGNATHNTNFLPRAWEKQQFKILWCHLGRLKALCHVRHCVVVELDVTSLFFTSPAICFLTSTLEKRAICYLMYCIYI